MHHKLPAYVANMDRLGDSELWVPAGEELGTGSAAFVRSGRFLEGHFLVPCPGVNAERHPGRNYSDLSRFNGIHDRHLSHRLGGFCKPVGARAHREVILLCSQHCTMVFWASGALVAVQCLQYCSNEVDCLLIPIYLSACSATGECPLLFCRYCMTQRDSCYTGMFSCFCKVRGKGASLLWCSVMARIPHELAAVKSVFYSCIYCMPISGN